MSVCFFSFEEESEGEENEKMPPPISFALATPCEMEELLTTEEAAKIQEALLKLMPAQLGIRKLGTECYLETFVAATVWTDGTLLVRCRNSKGSSRTYLSEAKRILTIPKTLSDVPPVYRKYYCAGKPPTQGCHILFGPRNEVLEHVRKNLVNLLSSAESNNSKLYVKELQRKVQCIATLPIDSSDD